MVISAIIRTIHSLVSHVYVFLFQVCRTNLCKATVFSEVKRNSFRECFNTNIYIYSNKSIRWARKLWPGC